MGTDAPRIVNDEVGEETFTFTASLFSWKPFAEELADFAGLHGLGFATSRKRQGPFGLLGVELTCTVTGRFSEITEFAEFAQARLRAWRDGSVAPG